MATDCVGSGFDFKVPTGLRRQLATCVQCHVSFDKAESRGGYYDICQRCVDSWLSTPESRPLHIKQSWPLHRYLPPRSSPQPGSAINDNG